MIVLMYVDDYIIVGSSMVAIGKFVKSMEVGPEKFTLTKDGNIDKFLGIEITHIDHRIFKKFHPFLIDRIVTFLKIDSNNYGVETNSKSMPVGKPIFHKDLSLWWRKDS